MRLNTNIHPSGGAGDWRGAEAYFSGFDGGNCVSLNLRDESGAYIHLHFHYRTKPLTFIRALKDAINSIPEDEARQIEEEKT